MPEDNIQQPSPRRTVCAPQPPITSTTLRPRYILLRTCIGKGPRAGRPAPSDLPTRVRSSRCATSQPTSTTCIWNPENSAFSGATARRSVSPCSHSDASLLHHPTPQQLRREECSRVLICTPRELDGLLLDHRNESSLFRRSDNPHAPCPRPE